jgi:hypothetical protein
LLVEQGKDADLNAVNKEGNSPVMILAIVYEFVKNENERRIFDAVFAHIVFRGAQLSIVNKDKESIFNYFKKPTIKNALV